MILTGVKLDLDSHSSSYKTFLDYFKLSPGNTDLCFLVKLLKAFSQIPYENISKIIRFSQSDQTSASIIRLPEYIKDSILFVNRTFIRETTFFDKKNFNIKQNYHSAINQHFGIEKQIVEQAQAALSENLKRRELVS